MADCMMFPKTADEFIEQYSFKDEKQEYTNGAELIAVFRVKQMMEHYFPVEVVHGHNTYDHNTAFECSVCGFDDWDTLTASGEYNYCPNCGAKMDG
jgi:predicted RNA-binding Zn-ribbon protein involved in translation (DUF1610 family)